MIPKLWDLFSFSLPKPLVNIVSEYAITTDREIVEQWVVNKAKLMGNKGSSIDLSLVYISGIEHIYIILRRPSRIDPVAFTRPKLLCFLKRWPNHNRDSNNRIHEMIYQSIYDILVQQLSFIKCRILSETN